MNVLERFGEYAGEFEKTFADDNWGRLDDFFHPDIVYTVSGSPYDCEISGREAVCQGLKKALDGFDRRFDHREIAPGGEPVVENNRVAFPATCTYQSAGLETLQFGLTETVEFDDSGLIVHIRDDYPDGQQYVEEWLTANKDNFDPAYV